MATDEQTRPADETPENGLREQYEAAVAERDANREQWLRSEAELENFRRRVRKENEEFSKYQSLSLARDLLPGLDNLDRAIAHAEETGNVEDLVKGIRMVAQQFKDALSRQSIEAIPAAGEPFDPNLHEAVQQIPSPDHPPMTVLQELETGYRMHDRVIRPAKVLVSSAPPTETAD